MFFVEAGRVAGVADDETGAVVVHPAFAASHEEVAGLAERAGAMHERRTHRGGTVARGRP